MGREPRLSRYLALTLAAAILLAAIVRLEWTISPVQADSTPQSASCNITPCTLPAAIAGNAYLTGLRLNFGLSYPYRWSVASGALPSGISLNGDSGVISGTPTATGSYSFTVQVSDNTSNSCRQTYVLVVNAAGPSAQLTAQPATNAAVFINILGTPGTANASVYSVIFPAVACISSSDGRLRLSLAEKTTATLPGSQIIQVAQAASPPAPQAGNKLVEAFSFLPDNATFSPSANLTIKYDPASLPSDVPERDLFIALVQGGQWAGLPSDVNTVDRTVTAAVSHFSTYGLLGKVLNQPPPAPPSSPSPQNYAGTYASRGRSSAASSTGTSAAGTTTNASNAGSQLTFCDIAVSPPVVRTGAPVTVSIRALNGGTTQEESPVELKVNGTVEAEKDVLVSPGTSLPVNFTVVKKVAGKYEVEIQGQQTAFEVENDVVTMQGREGLPVVAIIAICGLLVIAFFLFLIYRRQRNQPS